MNQSHDSEQHAWREWPQPELPPAPEDLTENSVKLRGVLKSLIDNEKSYVLSITRIAEMKNNRTFSKAIKKSAETKLVFEIADDILHIHKTFNIALVEELSKLYKDGSVAKCLTLFSSDVVFGVYSNYINNCEIALETVQKLNARGTLRGSSKELKRKMRIHLCSDMIKPVQRYPQLILITQDILKHTPYNNDARINLQEALTGIDTVAYKLNERKRQLDQQRNGRQIAEELPLLHRSRETARLVREDNMSKLCQEKVNRRPSSYRPDRPKSVTQKIMNGFCWKPRCLYLMTDTLVMKDDERRYIWHQSLDRLELTTSRKTLDALTRMYSDGILGKDSTDLSDSFDDVYQLVADINNIRDDDAILNKLTEDLKALKHRHRIQHEVDNTIADLQQMRHNKEYQLMQVLYDSCIFIYDTERLVTFAFWAPSAHVKQEWCVDFLLTKRALDPANSPSWYEQDPHGRTGGQAALLLKHIVIKTQIDSIQRLLRLNVKCAVCVKLPHGQYDLVEHLWVYSSNATTGHVSIVPMHSDDSTPIETFEVTNCNITCVERVPHTNERGITGDSVWMATSDSEIMVFAFSASRPDAHRTHTQVLTPGCTVSTMTYIDRKVFCGTVYGHILVYSKNEEGHWSSFQQIPFGVSSSVMSIICVGDSIWAGCGNKILLIDRKTSSVTDLPGMQKLNDPDLHVQFLVKAGVGVWVSFHAKSKLVLFHSESKHILQTLNIDRAVGEFLAVCTNYNMKDETFEVTSLVATLGSLWIGTNVGIILTYPVTRLRDGVPRINQRPQVARYGHSGPIKFLVPLKYDPVSGVSIRECPTSSVLVEQEHNLDSRYEEEEDAALQTTATYLHDIPESPQIPDTPESCPFEMIYSRTGEIDSVQLRSHQLESSHEIDSTDMENVCLDKVDEESMSTSDEIRNIKSKNRVSPESLADVAISEKSIDRLYSTLLRSNVAQDEMVSSDGINLQSDTADGESEPDMSSGESASNTTLAAEESTRSRVNQSQCNTILVVSGGNGFMEWKSENQHADDETQEPTLIFWIYKV